MPDESRTAGSADGQQDPTLGDGSLQFDRAEFSQAKKLDCSTCNAAITSEFYRIEGKPVCSACHAAIHEKLNGGSGVRRFVRAAIFGSLAMLLGAGIYYGILALTGYEVGLISILVGILVGSAVRHGSDQRGGWVYQGLAMFLTYTAIVSAYVPLLVSEFKKIQGKKPAVTQSAAATKGAAKTGAQPVLAMPPKNSAPKTAKEPAAIDLAAEDDAEQEFDEAAQKPPPSGFGIVVALAMLIGVIYAIPFLAGLQNIIGLAIIGFGLY